MVGVIVRVGCGVMDGLGDCVTDGVNDSVGVILIVGLTEGVMDAVG